MNVQKKRNKTLHPELLHGQHHRWGALERGDGPRERCRESSADGVDQAVGPRHCKRFRKDAVSLNATLTTWAAQADRPNRVLSSLPDDGREVKRATARADSHIHGHE